MFLFSGAWWESHVFPVHLIWLRCEEDMSLMTKGSFGTEPQDRAHVEQTLDQVVHATEQHAELVLFFNHKNACDAESSYHTPRYHHFYHTLNSTSTKAALPAPQRLAVAFPMNGAHRFGSKCDRPKARDIHFKMQVWYTVNLVTGTFLQFGNANPESTFLTGKNQWKTETRKDIRRHEEIRRVWS